MSSMYTSAPDGGLDVALLVAPAVTTTPTWIALAVLVWMLLGWRQGHLDVEPPLRSGATCSPRADLVAFLVGRFTPDQLRRWTREGPLGAFIVADLPDPGVVGGITFAEAVVDNSHRHGVIDHIWFDRLRIARSRYGQVIDQLERRWSEHVSREETDSWTA